jgi:hypothetical protein
MGRYIEGVEKGRFSSYFCSFFIKNHHIWQQNEGFFTIKLVFQQSLYYHYSIYKIIIEGGIYG